MTTTTPTRPVFRRARLPLVWIVLQCGAFLAAPAAQAQTDLPVYTDALAPGWQSWSWASVDLASPANPHAGTMAIAVTASPWSALSLRHDPLNTTGYGNLAFWINGGAGGQRLRVLATLNDAGQPFGVDIGPLPANTWQQVIVPLASLGAADVTNFTGFWLQEFSNSGATAPTYYVDDVVITGSVPTLPPPPLVGMALYQDAYVNGWENWSWASINTGNTNPVNSGTSSIAVNAGPYQALRFHHSPLNTEPYESLTFWIHGGSAGGQVLRLHALLSDQVQPAVIIGPLLANQWQQITVPLADLGVAEKPDLTDLWFQEGGGQTLPTFYVDDVRLNLAPAPALVNVTVDNRRQLRKVDPRLFGLNTAIWDGSFDTPTTAALLAELNNRALRFPGGSISDVYHWQTNMSEGQTFQWATSFDKFAHIATATNAQVYITVNYGTGTAEEAAEWVRYSNVTKGYGFKYWEVGNENYGTWEADQNDRPHDPVTYATRFRDYYTRMKAVDPTIKVGAVVVTGEDSNANHPDRSATNPRTGQVHHGWTPVMLATMKQLGCIPDFVVYHRYEQGPGGENDTYLLTAAATWPSDAANLRQMLEDYLGRDAKKVALDCTENNSVYGNPGKQTTSLVNGLFLADAVANVMKTEFSSFFWWDLRNGQEGGNNNSPFLYGWRNYGDYGIVNASTPAGPADRYPTFYVSKLLRHFARGGEHVLRAECDHWSLGAYAVRGTDDTLRVLLINKHPTSPVPVSIRLHGWTGADATVYAYGQPQDEAARTGTGSADIQESSQAVAGKTFTYVTEPYSATVLVIPNAE